MTSSLRILRSSFLRNPSTIRTFSTTQRQNIARVQLIGNIGTEPEVSTNDKGNEITKYSLAVNRGRAEERVTDWYRIIAVGEGQAARLAKGSRIFLEGDLRLNTYEGEDGKKHTSLVVFQRSTTTIARAREQTESESSE